MSDLVPKDEVEKELWRVEREDFRPDVPIQRYRVIHHKRVMWCRVDDREAGTVGDTDRHWCEASGHKLGDDGCMYRDILVLGYERG